MKSGTREADPARVPTANDGVAPLAVKAGTSAATIYLTERLWKQNRTAAVALMVAANGITAASLLTIRPL